MGANEVPPDMFFVPCYAILIALALYGKIENAYMIYGQPGITFNITTCVLFNIAFLGCIIFGWLYITERVTSFVDLKIGWKVRALSVIPLVFFLGCYATAIRVVNAQSVEVLRIPNFVPWLVTWGRCKDYIFLDPYHLVLFIAGFSCLLATMSIPLGMAFGKKAFASSLVSGFGALLVGLVYQDWFWFVSHPTAYLTYGGRYGVFFNQWMEVLGFHLPTMYVVAHILGLPMIVVPPFFLCRKQKAIPYIVGLFSILTVFIVSGVAYVKFVKNI